VSLSAIGLEEVVSPILGEKPGKLVHTSTEMKVTCAKAPSVIQFCIFFFFKSFHDCTYIIQLINVGYALVFKPLEHKNKTVSDFKIKNIPLPSTVMKSNKRYLLTNLTIYGMSWHDLMSPLHPALT